MGVGIIIGIVFNCFFILLNIYLFINYKHYKADDIKQMCEVIASLKQDQNKFLKQNQELKIEIFNRKQELDQQIENQKNKINIQLETYKKDKSQLINKELQQQQRKAQQTINNINQKISDFKETAKLEQQSIREEINDLKSTLNAGIELRLREQEKKEKFNFYKLVISKEDLADVKKLEELKSSLHKPVILSKLIWTQYFQKQMTELCNRVLGKNTICGIYKITNILDDKCYIGQSVNVAERWKDHCKCGLGIQASATNKLYNAMQRDKIQNFTFELLEECPKELLNEKERFWINMYQSNMFGYNSTKGNI